MDAKADANPAIVKSTYDPVLDLHRAADGVAFEIVAGILQLRDDVAITNDAFEPNGLIVSARAVKLPELILGRDYVILFEDGGFVAALADDEALGDEAIVGGFHFAAGGNATARQGGDTAPAINPCSLWDNGFRPTCNDPRGMAFIAGARVPFWCDIYLLGTNPWVEGTSCYGVTIADGDDLPTLKGGGDDDHYDAFDHPTATAIYAAFGKQLLGPEEFFEATFGVTDATSADDDPERTGLDAARTSKYGIMQATGNMSTWGGDGDPDGHRRACIFGGDWADGGWAGSRQAYGGYWPGDSSGWIGARGRSDHLQLDA